MKTRFQKRGVLIIFSLMRLTRAWSIQSEASMTLPFNSLMLDPGSAQDPYGSQA